MAGKLAALIVTLGVGIGSAHAQGGTDFRWNGAPELSLGEGWSVRLRGRVQLDGGNVNLPSDIAEGNDGGIEVRRLYVGAAARHLADLPIASMLILPRG